MQHSVLISGAGGALGSVLRTHLAASGWRVALLDRKLAALGADWGREVDLLDASAVAAVVAEADAAMEGLDAAVMIAGGFTMAAASASDATAMQAQIDLNLMTAVNVAQPLIAPMLSRGRGHLIGIGAAQVRRGGARASAYAASKAALASYLRTVDEETAEGGLRTTTLFPMGTLDTPANRQAMPESDPDGWIDPLQIAHSIRYLLELGPRARVRELEVYPDAARR
jgi:NADP-dependent 3-hydroxy acid dehydrogenase YdfG